MTAAIEGVQPPPLATVSDAPVAVANTAACSCVDAPVRAAVTHLMHGLLHVPDHLGAHGVARADVRRKMLACLRRGVCTGGPNHTDASRSPWMRGLSSARVTAGIYASLYVRVGVRRAAATHVCVPSCGHDQVGEWVAREPRAPLAAGVGPDGGGSRPASALGRGHARLDVCGRARPRGCPRGASRACARVSLQPGAGVSATRWTGARFGAARDLRARDERRINVADRRSRFYGPAR